MADDDLSLDDVFSDKAQLDTEELSAPGGGGSPAEDKVELDLDDAPFLEDDDDEEEEAPPPPLSSEPVSLEQAAPKANKLKELLGNKKVLIPLVGVLVLLLVLVAWLVLKPAPRPEIPEPQQQQVQVQQPPEPEPEVEKPEVFMVTWEPFWVELKDAEGRIRFLVCKFGAPTENEKLSWEAGSKKVVLRDAIFYYLRNKDLMFLSDKKNVDVLKADLLAVINQYMNNGQFEDVLIENYLVK